MASDLNLNFVCCWLFLSPLSSCRSTDKFSQLFLVGYLMLPAAIISRSRLARWAPLGASRLLASTISSGRTSSRLEHQLCAARAGSSSSDGELAFSRPGLKLGRAGAFRPEPAPASSWFWLWLWFWCERWFSGCLDKRQPSRATATSLVLAGNSSCTRLRRRFFVRARANGLSGRSEATRKRLVSRLVAGGCVATCSWCRWPLAGCSRL